MKKIICLMLTLALCFAVSVCFAETAEDISIFGEQDGAKYENATMGIGCVLEGWKYGTQDEIMARYNLVQSSSSEEVAELLKNNTAVIVMYANSANQTQNASLTLDSQAAEFVKAYGEAFYIQALINQYETIAPGQGWQDFTCEAIEYQIGTKTVKGVKDSFILNGVKVYQKQLAWLNGDYVDILTVSCYLTDDCDSVLEHFYLLGE